MTLLDPVTTMANLVYIGYSGDPSSAFHVTRRRHINRKKKQSERNVLQCFVFGPESSGKSALLNSFVGRAIPDQYTPTIEPRFAANIVEQNGETKKTLVLREIPAIGVRTLLSNKDSLAACDVAVFMYDSSDEKSWKGANDLLVEVASFSENNGIEIPSLIVAAKDDLDHYPTSIKDSTRASQDMGVEAPITISVKLRDLNGLFDKIVNAAQHPHLSIPETQDGRNRKHYRMLMSRSLTFFSVGAAVAIVGLAAYRVYAAHKHSSA